MSLTVPHRIGSWTCPSGNSVDVDIMPVSEGVATLAFAWDDPPPLSPDDARYYRSTIMPAVIRRVAEFTETPLGRTLRVELA